jgi:cytochrome c2
MLGLKPALALLAAALALGAGAAQARPRPPGAAGGDAARGRALIAKEGCGSCHEIPGVASAHGLVGPPLDHMARRTTIAGMLPNTPQNMVRWIEAPQSVVPGNAMPNMEINDHDARDVAAYLYTLR